jgi:hypothetical protein
VATTVIIAMREAELGRIMVQGQPEQKVHKTPAQQKTLDVVACACHPSDGSECLIQEDHSPGWPGQRVRPYFQNSQTTKGWRWGSSLPTKVQCPEFKPGTDKTHSSVKCKFRKVFIYIQSCLKMWSDVSICVLEYVQNYSGRIFWKLVSSWFWRREVGGEDRETYFINWNLLN